MSTTTQSTAQALAPRRSLLIGSAAHIVQDGLTATIYVLLPLLAQSFGLSYAQVGLFKGLKSVAQGLLETLSGFITERTGEVRLLFLGLLLSAAGYGLVALATGPVMVLICLAIIGAGTALHHAPSSALIVGAYPDKGRRGALGLYNSSGDVGKLAFTGLFSLAIGVGLAWQEISIAFAAMAVVAAAAILMAGRALTVAGATATDSASDDTATGWGILNWRAFSLLFAGVFLDTAVQAGVLVFVAFLMIDKGVALHLATLATVVLLVGGIFGKAFCGFLADRIGIRRAFAAVQVLTAVGLVAIVVAPEWLVYVILLPLGAVAQGSSSITYAVVADLVHPKRMARGYALVYGASSYSSAAGPLGFGVIADAFGIGSAIYVMAAIALVAAVPVYLVPRKIGQHTA